MIGKGERCLRVMHDVTTPCAVPTINCKNDTSILRLTIVSREAKKKQAVRNKRVSYLQVAPL